MWEEASSDEDWEKESHSSELSSAENCEGYSDEEQGCNHGDGSDGDQSDVSDSAKDDGDEDNSVKDDGNGSDSAKDDSIKRTLSWLEAENTDTSDEEEVRNTLGNVPLEWYEDYVHLGYDMDGHKLPKPASASSDEVLNVCRIYVVYVCVFVCKQPDCLRKIVMYVMLCSS